MAKPTVTVDNPSSGPRIIMDRTMHEFPDGKFSHVTNFKVTLQSGANVVDREEWDRVHRHPSNQRFCDEEGITFTIGGPTVMSVADAIALVKRTSDVELLGEWANNESRPKVSKALEAHLDGIRRGIHNVQKARKKAS